GVITEVTVKVHKIPDYAAAVRVSFSSVEEAAAVVQKALGAGVPVGRAELMDDTMVRVLNEANTTDHKEATTVLFELTGESERAVEEAKDKVLELSRLGGGGVPHVATDPEERRVIWRQRKEALWSLMGAYPGLECLITDVCVPLSRLADLIGQCKKELDASPLPAPIVAHAASGCQGEGRGGWIGDGNFHALIMFDKKDPNSVAEAHRLSSFMVYKALEMEGTCTGEHGVGTGKIKYLEGERLMVFL
ncbi:unnamed protein product, partial [Discosporangium mesarthrocarpum]